MLDPQQEAIETIACKAGWDSHTLLLQIALWLKERQLDQALIDHLDGLQDPCRNDHEFPVEDWQYEVGNDDTRLGYFDWARDKREMGAAGA